MAAYHYQQGDRPLDGYTIHYALGRGGFGEVYFAVSDSGREVALKAVQNYEEVELRGIGHCMNLKSPHLVMIFDVKHAPDGTPWVIMEYVSGPSLREVLDESPDGLGAEQAKYFLKELAKGLSYLHEAGVVHRDLKPHNVFFEDGLVKIGDYSLSKVITASHRSGNTMTVGSVHYMAPEISLGRYDKTVDIYALGVILFEMLTGNPPYMGESLGEVLMKHLSSAPDVSELPEPFASAVVKAMQRDPTERFQTSQEMVEAVTGKVASAPLMDSFNPATLSLVGERARAAKITPSATEQASGGRESGDFEYENNEGAETPRSSGSVTGEPLSHSTAPTVMQETSEYRDAATRSRRNRTLTALHRACLYYCPPDRVHAVPDQVPLGPRLLLAAVTTLLLVGVAAAMIGDLYGFPMHVVMVSVATFFLSATVASASWMTLPRNGGIGWAVLSRIAWSVPQALTLAFFVASGIGPNFGWPWICSMLVATLLFDWRCLVAPHRIHRVSIVPVIAIGAVAVLLHAFISRYGEWSPFVGAVAMAAAIVAQLVAPMKDATPDAPLLKRRGERSEPAKPRLLYDRTAMVLELVVGISAATAITALYYNGDADIPLIAVALIAGMVGLNALRYRLQRRAWPEADRAAGSEVRQNSPLLKENNPPINRGSTAIQPTITTDKTSMVLEFLFLAAVVVLGVAIAEGDDELFPVGNGALVVAVLAMRYRLLRRKSKRQQRSSGGKLPLAYDRMSIILEIGVGACLVGIAAGLFFGDHDEEMLVFAGVSAVVAVVLLRFRLARRTAA